MEMPESTKRRTILAKVGEHLLMLEKEHLSTLPFAIIDFINRGLAVIPTKWFTGPEEDECYWPPARVNIAKAVIEQQDPHPDWATYKLSVKRKAATYEIAQIKLFEFEQNTDVPTGSDFAENMGRGKRKKRSRREILSSEDEDDDNPLPPLPPSILRSTTSPPETPQMQIRDSMLFVRILTLLEELKETIQVHGRMLQTLTQHGDTLSFVPEGFPLKTVGEVEVMEEK
ncbi:uncharacterized protein LOC118562312, partial [Fundulus heteroclitus]|uniref:uncharacterized protein LOC118562312 n=1 Tax=Fundulus heteroclitus TaxID=8078 RepID=UPI00165A3814